MIIFTQKEYEKWISILETYVSAKVEATKLPEDKYLEALKEAENIYGQKRDKILRIAHERTIKGFSTEKLYEDTVATIMHYVWRQIRTNEITLGDNVGRIKKPAEHYDTLYLYEQIDEIERRADGADYYNRILNLWERYHNDDINREEASQYRDYQVIRVEIALSDSPDGPKDELAIIDHIYKAKQAIVTTDQLTKEFFKAQFLPDKMKPLTLKGGKKGEIIAHTYVTINYDGLENLKIFNANNSIEGFDRDVFNALISLIEAGNEYLTEDMIYRAMRGYRVTGQISDSQRADIMKSVRKLSVLRVAINTKAANDIYPELKEISAESAMLDIDIVSCKYRNTTVENMIRVKEAPLMLRYAKALNQLDRRPIEYLSCPISGTKENIELQGYLYRRIVLASSQKHLKNLRTILVEKILKAVGVSKETHKSYRKKKASVLKNVTKILDHWTDNNFIAGYQTEIKNNNQHTTITKFIIKLPE